MKNAEDLDEDDESIEMERANAKEEKEIMEVLLDILSDGKVKSPANGE